MSVEPKMLAGEPLNTIAFHGMPNLSTDGNTKARSIILARRKTPDELAISNGFSRFGKQNKRSAIQYSIGLGK